MPDPVPDPVPPPQPWYTSKTLWAIILGAVFNALIFFKVLAVDFNAQQAIDTIFLIVAGIARWNANQPLSLKATGSITKDGQEVRKL